MIQNVVESIGGVGAYGVISVCLFFTVFTGAMIWAFAQKKSLCKTMSALPLDDGERRSSADFQSAVSQVFNLRAVASSECVELSAHPASSAPSRLQVGDTAGLETCATTERTKGDSHE